ncbi:hypothetical protein BOW13_01985 [Solemya velum gill symbiont]|nr:hypothetical protein BOW08_08355 [Solemya velum gill symbiont]OOY86307.1 hypothetical protein BOW13_01985 [Solemya velum gill symbiont]
MKGSHLSCSRAMAALLLLPATAHATGFHIGAPLTATFFGVLLLPVSLLLIVSYLVIRRKPVWPDKKWKYSLYSISSVIQIILFDSLGAWLAYEVFIDNHAWPSAYLKEMWKGTLFWELEKREMYEALPVLLVIAALVRTHIVTLRVVAGKYHHQQ